MLACGKMPLKPFTYPLPETRFLHAGASVYKFKIKYAGNINGEEVENKESIVKELEEAIRTVLANLDNLQPFVTKNLIIFPYKSKWESVAKLRFKHGDIFLSPFPYVCTMYVESNTVHQNLFMGKQANSIHNSMAREESEVAAKRRRVEEPAEGHFAQPKLKRDATVLSSYSRNENMSLAGYDRNHGKGVPCHHYEGDVYGHKSLDELDNYDNYGYITPKRRKVHEMELQHSHTTRTLPRSESTGGGVLQFIARAVLPFCQLFRRRKSP